MSTKDSELKSALTPEQWANNHYASGDLSVEPWTQSTGHLGRLSIYLMDQGEVMCDECECEHEGQPQADASVELTSGDRHATAALLLYGQPFGFTWDDVDDARLGADVLEQTGNHANARTLRLTADRIAALLPPREKP